MRTFNLPKLDRIVKRYQFQASPFPDSHVLHCINQETLLAAIEVAAKAVDADNKTHFHQRRVGRAVLYAFAERLLGFEEELKKTTTFDQIFEIVSRADTNNIGELTIYDTAFRIGNYLKILPDKVYLHGGTRKGAEELLGVPLTDKKFLLMEELPTAFQRQDLTPSDVVEILFMFKDEFAYCVS